MTDKKDDALDTDAWDTGPATSTRSFKYTFGIPQNYLDMIQRASVLPLNAKYVRISMLTMELDVIRILYIPRYRLIARFKRWLQVRRLIKQLREVCTL